MDQVDARQRLLGKPCDQAHRIVEMQTDIAQAVRFRSPASALAMPLTKGSTPIMPVCGCPLRLRDHRFAAAETDFERNFGDRHRKQLAEIYRRGAGEIERQLRQQRLKQPRLVRTQLVALAPAEKRAGLDALAFPSTVMLRKGGDPVNIRSKQKMHGWRYRQRGATRSSAFADDDT